MSQFTILNSNRIKPDLHNQEYRKGRTENNDWMFGREIVEGIPYDYNQFYTLH